MVTAVLVLVWDLSVGLKPFFLKTGTNSHPESYHPRRIITPVVPGVNLPWSQLGFLCFGTAVSVGVHEAGHAIAAASEGVRTEKVAIFFMVVIPGALVELNSTAMSFLPPWSALKVYCAGVWHNVVLCLITISALNLLPLLLFPFYSSNSGLVVTSVPQFSPLTGHINTKDVITVVNNYPMNEKNSWHNLLRKTNSRAFFLTKKYEKWTKERISVDNLTFSESKWLTGQGYCVSNKVMEGEKNNKSLYFEGNIGDMNAKNNVGFRQYNTGEKGISGHDRFIRNGQVENMKESVREGRADEAETREGRRFNWTEKGLSCPMEKLIFREMRDMEKNSTSERNFVPNFPSTVRGEDEGDISILVGEEGNSYNPILKEREWGNDSSSHVEKIESEKIESEKKESEKKDSGKKLQFPVPNQEIELCLSAREIVELEHCGEWWDRLGEPEEKRKYFLCEENTTCFEPVLPFGAFLFKITFVKDESLKWASGDFDHRKDEFLVFGGDVTSLASATILTKFQPRKFRSRLFLSPGVTFQLAPLWGPQVLESFLIYICQVSAALALINMAPVFFLDGEAASRALLALIFPNLSNRRFQTFSFTTLSLGSTLFAICLLQGFVSLWF